MEVEVVKRIIKFVFLACLMISFKVSADMRFTADIQKQAEAANSAEAKDITMIKAQRDALMEVAERLTDKQNLQKLNELTDDQIQHFIQEVSVKSEKNGAKNYAAELSIKVNGPLLKQFMEENNMLSTTKVQRQEETVLIIPIYADVQSDNKILWGEDNLWRNAWLDKGTIKSGMITFKVIDDVASNRTLLNENNAEMMNSELYKLVSQNNKVNNVYTVQAVQAGKDTVVIIIKSFPANQEKRLIVFNQVEKIFNRAIADTVNYITEQLQIQYDIAIQDGKLSIIYEYANLKEWLETEQRLNQIEQISSMETGIAANGRMQFTVNYLGNYNQLVKTLQQNGYDLIKPKNKGDKNYILIRK